jgi:acylphosphatase
VGYRYFVLERARDLHLAGFCRNLSNGDVEVVAEGEEGALDALMASLRQGPMMAHVDNVHAVRLPATGEFTSFRVGSSR